MFKNALISVSDKSGLPEFVKPLFDSGTRIVSTGGTAKLLRESGIDVVDVSQQTKFPEVMDGRVKTLHPNIHMCLLARSNNDEDIELLNQYDLQMFDLVIGNLYPFSEALKKNLSMEEQIEFIDIGGPSFLRSAAKNYNRIVTVCDPNDYQWILEKKNLDLNDKMALASKVFAHTSGYDSIISNYLINNVADKQDLKTQAPMSLSAQLYKSLRYGENPQQKGHWYTMTNSPGLHEAEIIQGKPLSYNNLLDLDAAIKSLRRFPNENAVISVKHNNPCGIAVGSDLISSLKKSVEADPKSVFGGIIAVDGIVNEEMSIYLKSKFLECVIAEDFDRAALEVLAKKKNLRLLKYQNIMSQGDDSFVRSIEGGYLVQDQDKLSESFNDFEVIGEAPSEELIKDIMLAWKACAQLKSNAICIAGNSQTLGLGMGQVNRVDAVKHAIERAKEFHPDVKQKVLASDAFFPFADSIEMIHQAGINWVIQPGGSIRDNEVIERAKGLGVNLILTGIRHFLH